MAGDAVPSFYEQLVARARARSEQPGSDGVETELPASLRDIDWQTYRSIQFRPERSLWRGEPGRFEVQFFHPGYIYRVPVKLFVIEHGEVRPFPFSTDYFSYGALPAPAKGVDYGFAGLRLHTDLNRPDFKDELLVFQGASYFRSLGRHQWWGLSARALAIDTGEPRPEEFPRFCELYLVRPAPDAAAMWVLGLLESKRATGAYAFRVLPGDTTVIEVNARVFLREPVAVLGLAPLTSMYLFGEDQPARFGDYRPEVHDSDALVMLTQHGERIFRPLRNPPQTQVSLFRLDSPAGFGLVQRDRRFESYQDLNEHYESRPSAWVEPLGDWGPGAVRMQEMATPLETDDNIAVLWVPDQVPADGLALRYRIHFGADVPGAESAGRVMATRLHRMDEKRVRFMVDFAVPDSENKLSVPDVEVSLLKGELVSKQVVSNSHIGGYRASFEVSRADPRQAIDLRAFLRRGPHALTETWSYTWAATP